MVPATSDLATARSTWHETAHGAVNASSSKDFDQSRHPRTDNFEHAPSTSNSPRVSRRFTGQDLTSQSRSAYSPTGAGDSGDGRYDNAAEDRTQLPRTRAHSNYPSLPFDTSLDVESHNTDKSPSPTALQIDQFDEHSQGKPRKRQKVTGSRMSYPRKRASTACQICRVRKTKCDNQRPSCGSCSQLKVVCMYQDQNSDLSTFDPASLHILDRLNYSIRLLEDQTQTLARTEFYASFQPGPQHSIGSAEDAASALISPARTALLPGAAVEESPHFDDLPDDNAATLSEALDVAANCSSCRVLEWPVLRGCCDPNDIVAPIFETSGLPDEQRNRSSNISRGIQEQDVSHLILEFLDNVHIKNPILDPSELKGMARRMAEHGFGWDGASCLVLIACALANLSAPFEMAPPGKDDVSCLDAKDYPTAEAYYVASRKRVGLLGNSVLATQCYFLIGVYEMYSLRPLLAWLSFNRACMNFQTYLRTPSRHNANSRSSRRLEQRLYWSCLKSECEMREEIDLPPTGLAKVEYPDIFPSPPGGTPGPQEDDRADLPDTLESMFQRSWYYYLSEIACRRIANRITHALHKTDPRQWHTVPLRRMQRIAEELEAQVVQWSKNIPYTVAFEDQLSADELTYMLQARFLDLRERIWRPFIYLAIHHTFPAEEQVIVLTYAQRSLDLLMKNIDHMVIKHRHHGSWYACRQLFTLSLLLLAAVKSKKVTVPQEWRGRVELVLTCLKYWESEASDLRPARLTLSDILAHVNAEDAQRTLERDHQESR